MKILSTRPSQIAPPPIAVNPRNEMSVKRNPFLSRLLLVLLAVAFLISGSGLQAQTASAALSGIVNDQSGARISKARVTLVNMNTKDTRSTVTNSSGVFNFSGLDPNSYTITVSAKGFTTYVEDDIAMHPGDDTALPTIKMMVGAEDVTIEVSAHDVDLGGSGEVSSLITADDIQHLATEGRDVTELVKILPGFALQPGTTNGAQGLTNQAPDTEVVGPGGSLGNYAANGSPANGIGLISDGANVQDPSNAGTTTQSINMDQVQEVKISTANFGADTSKGPVVINAVGKAGGQSFHGSVYLIGRTYQLNAQDWLLKNQLEPKPDDRYIYPGFTLGGPVLIPGTHFNSGRKLVFFIGGEDYVQRNSFIGGSGATALHLSTVPTDCMRGLATDSYAGAPCANPGYADLSSTSLANLFNVAPATLAKDCNPANPNGNLFVFLNFCQGFSGYTSNGYGVVGGLLPVSSIDPGAASYLANIIPRQNRAAEGVLGTLQESDGFDRKDVYLNNNDLYQIRGRLDFNISQSNKLYGVYNVERGYNFSPFINGNGANATGASGGVLHDPSLIKAGINSQTASANFVHIFSPSLTSETFVAASYYFNNFYPINQAANTAAALNYPYVSPLQSLNGTKQVPQLGYSSGIPAYLGPDYTAGQNYYRKISINAGDNVTKVYKQHTFKVGFYFERIANDQIIAGDTQGQISEYGTYGNFYYVTPGATASTCCTDPNNTIGMFLIGDLNYFGQQTYNPVTDMFYNIIDGFVQDSWKATRRLTIDAGVRFDHLGPWEDPKHVGVAFWYPQNYVTPSNAYGPSCAVAAPLPSCATGVSRTNLPGVSWHALNNSITDGVEQPRWAFVSPRAGFAFNAYGDGKTVFNGGVGLYRSHDSWNDYAGALNTARGVGTIYYNNLTLGCANKVGNGTAKGDLLCNQYAFTQLGGNIIANQAYGITVADPNDNEQPLTLTYSFGVDQTLRHVGNMIVKYVGNQSSNLLLTNGFGGNINTIKQGGLYLPDPEPLSPYYLQIAQSADNISEYNDYRPFPFYGNVQLLRHGLHSTYNALQATVTKYSGPFHFNFNYTWSKALGDRGVDGNGGVADATNQHNDYGIAAFDRTHIFNSSYTYIEGRPFHVDRFVSGFINGWEISGITNLQSGPNIQASYGNNFQLNSITCAPSQMVTCNGLNSGPSITTDNKTYLGTTDIQLQPIMTCDPSRNLHKGQFINSSCLTLGPLGVNGPFRYPYLRGPAFFNSDLSVQKAFRFEGKRELQFRFAAFNFLNHPLTSLVAATASPLRLAIAGPGGVANSTFGISDYKQGRRVSEVTIRFNF
jgi:hypothetical protein